MVRATGLDKTAPTIRDAEAIYWLRLGYKMALSDLKNGKERL
jgi:hypothetical protein